MLLALCLFPFRPYISYLADENTVESLPYCDNPEAFFNQAIIFLLIPAVHSD